MPPSTRPQVEPSLQPVLRAWKSLQNPKVPQGTAKRTENSAGGRQGVISSWVVCRIQTCWGKLICGIQAACNYRGPCFPGARAKSIRRGTASGKRRQSNVRVQGNNLTDTRGGQGKLLQQGQHHTAFQNVDMKWPPPSPDRDSPPLRTDKHIIA